MLGRVEDAVVGRPLIGCADQRAFRTGAIVAVNVDDQRVIQFALILNLLNHAANFMIRVGDVGSKDIRLARVEFLLNQ